MAVSGPSNLSKLDPRWREYIEKTKTDKHAGVNQTNALVEKMLAPFVEQAITMLTATVGQELPIFRYVVDDKGAANFTQFSRYDSHPITTLQKRLQYVLKQPRGLDVGDMLRQRLERELKNSPWELTMKPDTRRFDGWGTLHEHWTNAKLEWRPEWKNVLDREETPETSTETGPEAGADAWSVNGR
jgi:hypothetical protein